MRKSLFCTILSSLVLVLAFSSCRKPEPPVFSVSTNALVFESNETTAQTIAITTNDPDWKVTAQEDWVQATKSDDGQSASITVARLIGSPRTAKLVFVSEKTGESIEVDILQADFVEMPYGMAQNYGDEYNNNTSRFVLSLKSETIIETYSNETLVLEFNLGNLDPKSPELESGVYKIGSNHESGTLTPGDSESESSSLILKGSHIYTLSFGSFGGGVDIESGTVLVKKEEGIYTVYFVGTGTEIGSDDKAGDICYKYHGDIYVEDEASMPKEIKLTESSAAYLASWGSSDGENTELALSLYFDGSYIDQGSKKVEGRGQSLFLTVYVPFGADGIPDGEYSSSKPSDKDGFIDAPYSKYTSYRANTQHGFDRSLAGSDIVMTSLRNKDTGEYTITVKSTREDLVITAKYKGKIE